MAENKAPVITVKGVTASDNNSTESVLLIGTYWPLPSTAGIPNKIYENVNLQSTAYLFGEGSILYKSVQEFLLIDTKTRLDILAMGFETDEMLTFNATVEELRAIEDENTKKYINFRYPQIVDTTDNKYTEVKRLLQAAKAHSTEQGNPKLKINDIGLCKKGKEIVETYRKAFTKEGKLKFLEDLVTSTSLTPVLSTEPANVESTEKAEYKTKKQKKNQRNVSSHLSKTAEGVGGMITFSGTPTTDCTFDFTIINRKSAYATANKDTLETSISIKKETAPEDYVAILYESIQEYLNEGVEKLYDIGIVGNSLIFTAKTTSPITKEYLLEATCSDTNVNIEVTPFAEGTSIYPFSSALLASIIGKRDYIITAILDNSLPIEVLGTYNTTLYNADAKNGKITLGAKMISSEEAFLLGENAAVGTQDTFQFVVKEVDDLNQYSEPTFYTVARIASQLSARLNPDVVIGDFMLNTSMIIGSPSTASKPFHNMRQSNMALPTNDWTDDEIEMLTSKGFATLQYSPEEGIMMTGVCVACSNTNKTPAESQYLQHSMNRILVEREASRRIRSSNYMQMSVDLGETTYGNPNQVATENSILFDLRNFYVDMIQATLMSSVAMEDFNDVIVKIDGNSLYIYLPYTMLSGLRNISVLLFNKE